MRVGAAKAKAVDGGAPRFAALVLGPVRVLDVDRESATGQVDLWVRARVRELPRNLVVFERLADLDHRRHTRGPTGMTDQRLDAAHESRRLVGERALERLEFHRVADRRRRGMRFDVLNRPGVERRPRIGHLHRGGLALGLRHVDRCALAVARKSFGANDADNLVAGVEGVG